MTGPDLLRSADDHARQVAANRASSMASIAEAISGFRAGRAAVDHTGLQGAEATGGPAGEATRIEER